MKNFIRLITEDEKWSKVWFGLFLLMGTISGIVVGVLFWDDSLSFLQNVLPIVTTPIGFSCFYLYGIELVILDNNSYVEAFDYSSVKMI